MTPADLIAARASLGTVCGLSRPLGKSELARLLGVTHQTLWNWETGRVAIPQAIAMAITGMLTSPSPPVIDNRLATNGRKPAATS